MSAGRAAAGSVSAAAPASRGRVGASTAKTLTIGEVLDQLRLDYPDVTLSKIRYLEAEGLVVPARTSANYRKYSSDDVARLRYVLGAQRERFLPLRVIKEELESLDRGLLPRERLGPRPVAPPSPGALDVLLDSGEQVRMSRRELLAATGVSEEELAELEQYGLLAPRPGGSYFDGDALAVARTFAALSGFGIQPRHLRPSRVAADREAGLIEQVAAPLRGQRDPFGGGRAEEILDEIAGLLIRLHAALLRSRLHTGPGA
ncbi:transcriptional regulator FtsR [Protofrankia symbiont of Coriaria ruscifolia]|uniref:Regulatory protein MerR n=1 Tax=Candidatus Protofrankia californiensis TaxID=1839754 RepID=A0A1C3NZR6_9ACTN|nr:MerR family transcriptional regulator [Protofrankia symbiont of Coriaria ruscifolia]SBW23056.1 regulatory protein MerR [Candidatus Protofrankia californiensis]